MTGKNRTIVSASEVASGVLITKNRQLDLHEIQFTARKQHIQFQMHNILITLIFP